MDSQTPDIGAQRVTTRHPRTTRHSWTYAAPSRDWNPRSRIEASPTATSLGAVESTIERRASIPGQEHLPPALLRLSVGIEAVEDLWTDLDRALRNVPEM